MQRRLNWLIFTLLIWPYYWLRMYVWWPLRKKPENQIADIGRLIDLRPDYAPFYLRRALTIAELGKPIEQGLADCEKARTINPMLEQRSDFYLIRARLYYVKGDIDASLAQLGLALNVDSRARGVYFLRAYIHEMIGDYPQAISDYRQGLKHDFGMNRSEYADVYALLAAMYIKMVDYKNAEIELNKAARYSPQHTRVIQQRITIFAHSGDVEGINREISELPSKNKSDMSIALRNRSFAYKTIGDFDAAMQDLNTALELEPNDVDLYLRRGRLWLQMQNFEMALEDMLRAVKGRPNSPGTHDRLAYVYLLMGDLDSAKKELDFAYELNPQYIEFKSTLNTRAHFYLIKDDPAVALKDFEAMKRYPAEITVISAQAGQAVAHYALADADSIDTAVAQWRALCERHADRDLLVYLREQAVWPSRSLELAEQLNALTFPSSSPSP